MFRCKRKLLVSIKSNFVLSARFTNYTFEEADMGWGHLKV